MSVWSLAFRRMAALGYALSPGFLDPSRLRPLERCLRKRQLHRDATAIGALADSIDANDAAIRERDPGAGLNFLHLSDERAALAVKLLMPVTEVRR